MKKILFCLVIAGVLPAYSCCSSQQGAGIGKADSIHVEYCGMGGTTRYVINHSDTIMMLKGNFLHDIHGVECPSLFEPVRKVTSDDVPVIQRLAHQLFVEHSKPDTLWTKPYQYGMTCLPILSVHVFKKGKKVPIIMILARKRMA